VTEDDKYFIGYKSLKGAPDFQQKTANGKKVYRWEDAARDKMSDTRFVNDFIEMPSIKFQVIYARNNSKNFVWFKNESEMKNDISDVELAEKAKTFWFQPEKLQSTGDYMSGLKADVDQTVKTIYKSLKKKGITDATDEEYARKAYYLIRSQTLYNNWSDYAFAKIFSALLAEKKLDHEIIVSSSNLKTSLSKVAFTQELAWLVKFKNKYYCNPGEHLNPEDIPVYLAGNNAIRFRNDNSKTPVSTEVIPLSDTSSNVLKTQLKTSLDGSSLTLAIDKNVEARGLIRDDMIEEALALTPYMEADYRNYDGMGMWDGLTAKQEDKAVENFNELKKQWKEEKPDMMKAMAENEYGHNIEKYNSFRVVQDGRAYKKRQLRYSESFILSDMTARAGDDLLVALPSLIGQQTKINKEEKNRVVPADVRYPRTLEWYIVFPIPPGYTVKGIDGLSQHIANDYAAFNSAAKVENNNLIIEVSKTYKAKYFDLQQWPKLMEVLEAAYNFSQSRVVLKKQ
jgi:hypothetical protein